MASNPLLSVIIPVYNAEQYIEECIRSVELQGFDENELEIVCIDDGSKDRSLEILQSIARSDSRVKVFHQDNAGVSAARNRGLEIASGHYFEFVDADDKLLPGAMLQVCSRMAENNCTVAQFDSVSGGGYSSDREIRCTVGRMTLSGTIWRYVFSREQFGGYRFDTSMKYAEDTLFAQTTALNNPKCLCVQEQIYVYRENPESAMRNRNFHVVADCMLKLALHHKRYLDEGRFPGEEKRVKRWCARSTAAYMYYLLRAGDTRYPFNELKVQGLWPYKKEWNLLRPHVTSKSGIKGTLSGWSLFFVGFRPCWWIMKTTKLLYNR